MKNDFHTFMIPNNQPVIRDFTPNSPTEIVRRLRTVFMPVSGFVGLTLAATAYATGDDRMTFWAGVSAVLFVILLLIPKRWRTSSSAAVMSHAAKISEGPSTAGARPRILLLNASLAGAEGNSARLLEAFEARLLGRAELIHATLAGAGGVTFAELEPRLRSADAFVFATGTHWDSWSSPLQVFLEDATPAEATALWLGKPAAVFVTEHGVGGKGVLSRLQGVLVTLGCSIPPLSGLVLSLAAQEACAARSASADHWSPEDLTVVADNLLAAARQPRVEWRTWPVDRTHYRRVWIEPSADV